MSCIKPLNLFFKFFVIKPPPSLLGEFCFDVKLQKRGLTTRTEEKKKKQTPFFSMDVHN